MSLKPAQPPKTQGKVSADIYCFMDMVAKEAEV